MVEAAGIEPASLTNPPAATTCLVRRMFSAARWRPDPTRTAQTAWNGSARRARSPRRALPAMAFLRR